MSSNLYYIFYVLGIIPIFIISQKYRKHIPSPWVIIPLLWPLFGAIALAGGLYFCYEEIRTRIEN